MIAGLEQRFAHVIAVNDSIFDPKYLVSTALDPNTARSLEQTGDKLAEIVSMMVSILLVTFSHINNY